MKNPVKKQITGYTLLEMSIVIFVVGIVMASVASAYGLYLKNKASTETINNVNTIMSAVSNYFVQNGKYPCPARLNAQRTDPDYGMPTNCTTDPAILAMNPGDYLNGLYMEERDSTIATLVPPKPIVLRGAVPFRILNKPEYMAEDGYHNRLEYAVTSILTDATTYNKDHGAISVVDALNGSLVENADSLHFIVLSHGPDKEGAWSNNGAQILPCGAGLDGENCNTSTPNKSAIYRMAQTSTADGPDHFDDLVKFFSTIETPLWTVADAAGTNIRDAGLATQAAIGKANSVYEGTTTPTSLDVVTHVRADNDLKVGQWCNSSNPTDCFSPSLIGGNDPAMDCAGNPSGPYVKGVGFKQVSCTSTANTACPAGKVMIGVMSNGSLICSNSPVSCSATPVAVCSVLPTTDYVLPAAAVGTVHTTPIFGDSRQRKFVCSAAGTWVNGSPWAWGSCNCTPSGPTTVPISCNTYKGTGCWTGNVDKTTTVTCNPMATTVSYANTSNCVCDNCVKSDPKSCSTNLSASLTNPTDASTATPAIPTPAGWLGTVLYNRNWQCSSATAGSFVNWTYLGQSPTCTCNTAITPWKENGVACTTTGCLADGTWDSQGQFPCSAGFTGYVNREKPHDCATGTWATTWTNTANTCTCSAVTAPDPIPCPVGYSGTINRTKTFDCGTNSWGAPVNDLPGNPPSSCQPIRWVPQGSITGSGASKIGVETYTSCGPVNNTSSCSKPSGSGSGWDYYAYCKCQ